MLLESRLVQFIRKYFLARLQQILIDHVGGLFAVALADSFDGLGEHDGGPVRLVQSEMYRDWIGKQRCMLFPSHVGANFLANEKAGIHELEPTESAFHVDRLSNGYVTWSSLNRV